MYLVTPNVWTQNPIPIGRCFPFASRELPHNIIFLKNYSFRKRMTAMLDNPQGRDCNEMVGYQVRHIFVVEGVGFTPFLSPQNIN